MAQVLCAIASEKVGSTSTDMARPRGTGVVALFHRISLLFLVLSLFAGCARSPKVAEFRFVPPPYARHLKGFTVCLDPGHGGQGHIPDYKRGPTGLREADVNLRVALYLRDLLQDVGASVVMTRVDDSYVSLSRRSEIANASGADLFISFHHNGIDDPKVNYTSTWYHGDADDSRPSLDLARYIQRGVSDALQLPTAPVSGLFSDKLMTAAGFGVLRRTDCPAVLCEASFLSNPAEETRLKSEAYLRREATGYFIGIARYVDAGFPKGVLVEPADGAVLTQQPQHLRIRVMDGLHERGAWILKRQQVFSDSIQVTLDNVPLTAHYDRNTDHITVPIENRLPNGWHVVQTDMVNYHGNHSHPAPQLFKVARPAETLTLTAWTDTLPADGASYVGITVTARDADGEPIADDEPIYVQTSNGVFADTRRLSENGAAQFYLYAPDRPGTATVEAVYQQTRGALTLHFSDIESAIFQGQISDADSGKPLQCVQLQAPPDAVATTDSEGHFFLTTEDFGEPVFRIVKEGYYPMGRQVPTERNRATRLQAALQPIAGGVFSGTLIVLDSQTETAETAAVLTDLERMLRLAGATVHNIYTPDSERDVEQRIAQVNAIAGNGYYLQINHGPPRPGHPAVRAAHYRGNQRTETFLKRVLEQFNSGLYETPIVTVQDTTTPEIQQTNKMAMVLQIGSLNRPDVSAFREASAVFFGAWRFLQGDAEIDSEERHRFLRYLQEGGAD